MGKGHYDLVYLGKRWGLLHIEDTYTGRCLCGPYPFCSRYSYMTNVAIEDCDPVTCIRCSKAADKIMREKEE